MSTGCSRVWSASAPKATDSCWDEAQTVCLSRPDTRAEGPDAVRYSGCGAEEPPSRPAEHGEDRLCEGSCASSPTMGRDDGERSRPSDQFGGTVSNNTGECWRKQN